MLDLKFVLADPEGVAKLLAARGVDGADRDVEKILNSDRTRREKTTEHDEAKSRKNRLSKEIGQLIRDGKDVETLKIASEVLSQTISTLDKERVMASLTTDTLLNALPNLPAPDVPLGDETANVVEETWGTPREFDKPLDHVEIGTRMGLMDFEQTAKMSGSRFVTLQGPLAKLERALGDFMIDNHTQYGYVEVSPPNMVQTQAMFGTGQFPKFFNDVYRVGDEDLPETQYLIPTAEVSLTNLVRETLLPDATGLPIRMVAQTPCYRAEAGSAGRDTRGMIRQHQFKKVELVSICTPEHAAGEHARMVMAAERILKLLNLPFRRVLLASGDMGFSACKTYDLEVWLPSQNTYREISSISNCGDFQARRMDARYRGTAGKPTFLHTLNGSGLAVGRTLVAILENNQTATGAVIIPHALKPYMRASLITADGRLV